MSAPSMPGAEMQTSLGPPDPPPLTLPVETPAAAEPAQTPEQQELARAIDRNTQVIEALTRRPQQAPTPQPQQPQRALEAPDPVTHPREHQRWVQQEIDARVQTVETRRQNDRVEMENRAAMAEMWQDFQRSHPEESMLPELVVAALETETQGTFQVTGSQRSDLMKRVAGRVKDRLAPIRAANNQPTPSPTVPATLPAPSGRTAGVAGGTTGGAAGAGGAAGPEKKTTYVDELKDLQSKSPYW